jgi:hypothetical protein
MSNHKEDWRQMKSVGIAAFSFLWLSTVVFGQTEKRIYVRSLPGRTIGEKVAGAQNECPADGQLCMLVLDSSLLSIPIGTMPELCPNCSIADHRGGLQVLAPNVQSYPGPTADAQLNACLAANDICDARGYGATTQTIASTVQIGKGGANKALIVSPNTVFRPANATVDMFQLDHNGQILGHLYIKFPSSMTFAGKALQVLDTVGTSPGQFYIDGVTIDASLEKRGTAAGYGVYLSPPSGSYIQLASFQNITVNGLKYDMYLNAAGKGTYINGNNFSNITLLGDGNMLTFNCIGGLQENGNQFSNLTLDGLGAGISYTGDCPIQNNTFSPAYIWDSPTPISNANAEARRNKFVGNVDSAITDKGSAEANWPYQNTYDFPESSSGKTFKNLYVSAPRGKWSGMQNKMALAWNSTGGQGEADYFADVFTGPTSFAHLFYVPTNTGWKPAGGFLQNGQFVVGGLTVSPALSGVSPTMGGRALSAGRCATALLDLPGTTTAMAVDVSPVIYPGDGFYWRGYVSAAGTVTVKVCAVVAGSPIASAYNVRVIQ